ncbi:MAG: nucleotidyltransferase family protein [Solirubrobacterales bacterium]|nr:nucleotidyltransferase family protein [Solirubrobacterales bacterium]
MSRPVADLRQEAPRVLDELERRGVTARAVGGLAVHLRCPSANQPPLARAYKDLDLAIRRSAGRPLGDALEDLGYEPDKEFNALHGRERMMFWDVENERQLDVFVDRMVLCHTLEFADRLTLEPRTLPLADLLLAKLQVVELNERDLKDAAALLADHELGPDGIAEGRVVELLANDWGWWRTTTATLERLADYATRLDAFAGAAAVVQRATALRERIDAAPKSRRWRMRAKIGERKRWYELPEETPHQ